MAKGTKYSQQFKEDAVQYRLDHPELPLRKAGLLGSFGSFSYTKEPYDAFLSGE